MMKFRTLSIAVAAALAMSSPLIAQSSPSLHVNIAAQSLSSALGEFAKQAKLQLIVDSKLLEDKKAPTLQGDMSLKEALDKLLKGTGLEATIQGDTMVIKPQNDAEVALDAITINAAQATTEGTGSYTTGSTNTATKLNLSLRDTPQSVVVVTHQQIEDQNLESLADVTSAIAGFYSPTWDTERTYIVMRGFEVDYYKIDGMPTEYAGDVQQDMLMYDHVEVVRGANGLMSGAGSPAASIDLVRKHATSKEATGSVTAKAGSWDNYRGTLDVQSGVNEEGTVRARMVVSKEDKDSFRNFYHRESELFYGIVDADIGESTHFYVGASYEKHEGDGSTWGGVPAWFSDGTRTDFGTSASFTPKWTSWDTTTKSVFTGIEHTFTNDIKLNARYTHLELDSDSKIALTGYYDFPDRTTGLFAGSPYTGAYPSKTKQDSVDLYTSIPFEVAGLNHEILVGTTYSKKTYEDWWNYSLSGAVATESVYNWTGSASEPEWSALEKSADNTTTQLGAYLASRISLRDDLKLIVGSRVSNWKYENKLSDYSYDHQGVLTPYAGLIYDLDTMHSVYVSYTDIFKPQDYRDKNGNYLDPKEGKSYEAGIKGEYFGGKLNAAVAIFRIEQDNVAEADGANFVPGTTTQAYYGAEGVVSKGFEIDLSGEITPEWSVALGWAQFEAKDASDVKVLTTEPRKQAKLSTTYKIGNVTLGSMLSWQSKIYNTTQNPLGETVDLTLSDVVLVNVMAKYQITKALSAQLNVDNLFNKEYYSNITYDTQLIYGDPRTVTLTMKYTF
jgi:outer-membrane receptor for ferric coprogen and ferric-rhodotorulic acid